MKTFGVLGAIVVILLGAFGANAADVEEPGNAGPDSTILPTSAAGSAYAAGVYFGFEMAELTPEAFVLVEELAQRYWAGTYREAILIGHADTAEANPDELSAQRAAAVRDALVALGLDGFDISIEAWGTRGQPYPRGEGVREPLNRPVEVYFIELSR